MNPLNIDLNAFNKLRVKFREEEIRAPFFDMSAKLLKDGYTSEAYILILSTWNFAYFRYVVNRFNLEIFEKGIKDFENTISGLINLKFSQINFDSLSEKDRGAIINAFEILSHCEIEDESGSKSIIGITGASKILHLKQPELFIIWDGYIRGNKTKKLYQFVDTTLKNANWEHRKYKETGEGYFNFLKDMKDYFSSVIPDYERQNLTKPVTKAIDEFNYVGITKSIMDYEKKLKEQKKY